MIQTILNRRSVRRFENAPVEEEKLQLFLQAAMQAPSAPHAQPWEFVAIKDKDALKALSLAQPYDMAMKNAPMGILTLCNKERCTDGLDESWQENMYFYRNIATAQGVSKQRVFWGMPFRQSSEKNLANHRKIFLPIVGFLLKFTSSGV